MAYTSFFIAILKGKMMIKLTICYGFGGHYIFSDKAQLSFPVQKQSSKTSSGGLDV